MSTSTIRQASVWDISELARLLLEACADDELHWVLEPRQQQYPQDMYRIIFRGVRDKLLNSGYVVDVIEDGERIVGMAAWGSDATVFPTWWEWACNTAAKWWDRAAAFVFGEPRSSDAQAWQSLKIASSDMIARYG